MLKVKSELSCNWRDLCGSPFILVQLEGVGGQERGRQSPQSLWSRGMAIPARLLDGPVVKIQQADSVSVPRRGKGLSCKTCCWGWIVAWPTDNSSWGLNSENSSPSKWMGGEALFSCKNQATHSLVPHSVWSSFVCFCANLSAIYATIKWLNNKSSANKLLTVSSAAEGHLREGRQVSENWESCLVTLVRRVSSYVNSIAPGVSLSFHHRGPAHLDTHTHLFKNRSFGSGQRRQLHSHTALQWSVNSWAEDNLKWVHLRRILPQFLKNRN